jgi:predicted kinase
LISDINAQVETDLKAVGLDGAYTMRVAEPEFHIARALVSVMMPEGIPTSPSVVFQSSGVSTRDNEEATPMVQLSRDQQKAFVTPSIAVAPVPTGNALVTMQEAEAIGRADQAMQQSAGVKVVSQSPEVRQRQAQFVQGIIDRLTTDIDKKLDAARSVYEKKNAGETPVLYAYEAYELRDVYDVERGEPMTEMEVTESGESIPKLRWDAKAMDYVPVTKTARVRTTIYSYEDLTKLKVPVKQSANLYETDRHSSSTESTSKEFKRLEFGSDRPIWINIKGKEVPSKNKAKVVSTMVGNIEGRVRDVATRWTSEYNDALAGDAINPTEAWKPQEFDAEVKMRESDGITILAPSVKVRGQGYAIDTVEGNKGWNSLTTKEIKQPLSITQARKELLDIRKVDGTENKHHAISYPIEVDAKGKPSKWGYSLMVRTTDVDAKTGTFQWKIENDWGPLNTGFASSKDALKEAQIEHDKLFGLAREKQEEEVSRHIAREVIDIIDAGRKALDKWNADNNYKFTAEEANAVNILRQFRWYKGMEERLKGTYGQFTTVMADVLGATSPQTPVWQNYAATLYLMQGDKGAHSRRVKLSAQSIARNPDLLNYFPDDSSQKKAMVVVKADMSRTITVLKMHSILVKALDKSFGTNPQLTVDGLREQIADRLRSVYERDGVDDTSAAEADLFMSLMERDVPAAKRQETLDQFNRYADKSLPSRMGGTIKKDTQFRSFVNEVEDWISPKGEITKFGGKTAVTTKLADIPKGIKLSLSETIVPRNLVTGALYGSNSGNILMALTNEWLTVTEGMSAKARNFAMNFVGLSRGATIDVWAARLTRRHLNEVYMGVYTTRDGESRVEDVARYGAWSQLPESERKQFFRMSPLQEQGVAGGYVTNLPKKVSSNGYFTETDAETDPVKFAPANREQVDVTNAEFIGEFGMANRVFDRTAELINGYIGEAGFMSPADLQAVVWFAEKERWVQNGWTTAAGAGGSFEQMYHEMMERAGAYERVSGTVYQPRMRMRGAAAANLSVDEQKSLFDIATWPFLRHRRDSYQEGMGDLQREELVDGTNRHPVQSVQALAVTVSNDGMYTESAENANKTNLSVTYLTGAGREAKERSYTEPIPTVIVPEADADIMFKGMTNSSRTIYLPVENSSRVLSGLHNYAVGARTSFGIAGTNGTRLLGTGVIDAVAILDAADVPDDAPAKVKHQSEKYVRIQLAETQPMTDSDVYLWNNSGRSEKLDTRTNEYTWGLPLQAFDSAPSFNADADRGVSENRVYVGQIPLGAIKNANGKKEKKNILPKPAGIPAAHPANRVMVIESTASLLSAMRDATDVFMTTTRAVASADDPYASFLDVPSSAIGKVPMGEAWKNSKPDSNMRFGAYMLLRMPVGAERLIAGSRQAADNAHRRLMTSLRDSMPDVGYMVRIDADVRDWVSDITGNVGMPYVEIVFSPEEFIRNYNPITEVNGELPANAAERSALFNAYINGDIDAIRAAEEKFADAYESWMRRVTTDPDLSAQVMLPGLTVYDLQVIPKEKLLNAPSIREFAVSEVERQAANTNIGNAVREYAEAIGKTVDVEITDEFYASPDQPRVAQPDSILEDWSDFREYTVMAQSGRPRIAEVTVSAYAGESRMGFQNIYSAALSDIRNGSYAEAQRKFGVISEAAGIELENAFGEFATSMSADITASVIAGDAKPSVTATVSVTADRLGTVIGRAALIGRKLGQANTFVTEKAGRTRYGIEADGAMIVPSLSITLNEPLDSVGLRTLVDSAPAIFQGATQSPDKRTLTVFMVPDANIATAEAKDWTNQATTLLNDFVQTYTTPADSYSDDMLARLSMEVAPGEGSPAHALVGDAFYELSTEKQHDVNRNLTETAIREVEAIMGIRLKSVVFGLGGWQHYQNASTVLQANLTPKQAEIAAHMLGYTLQQTAVWSNKIKPFSKASSAYAVDFIEVGGKTLADSDKLSQVWARLVEADDTSTDLDNKLFQGFQPIRTATGQVGIRVIIKSPDANTGDQVERLLNGPIKSAVKSLDIELDVDGYSCDLVEAENDWKEQRNGESYVARLGDLLGPSAQSTIAKLDTARQKLEQQLKSAIDTTGVKPKAIAAGRRRLWNLGSVELGAKGRFIEYETVRDIVSNVAPDDSLPTAEKVANTVNQAQRREVEEALSVVAGQRINLPKRVRFKRTPEHSIFQMHVGRHYENMPKNALKSDPYVKVAYEALVSELDMQYRSLNLSVDFMQPVLDRDGKPAVDASGDPMYIDPYTNAEGKLDSTLAIRDVRENRHLYVYPTTEGTVGDAGDKADFDYLAKNHPLFQQSGFKTKTGQPMMWNDVLRAVHDALAHGIYGSSFNENGEENAFVAHAILTQNPWAIWALATETRMQNSWVHYGPHRVLTDGSFVTTKPDGFASQKVGLSSLECLYTGCSTVDDRLRVFSQKLRTDFGGYNGTISYLSGQTGATVPNMGSQTGAVQSEMKRKLYIMRGLPGSGKSTKARELAGNLGQIFSTDEYFMQDGKYQFDASRLPEYHRRNLDDSTMAMRRGTGVVVIDNTNIEPWHFEKYLESGRLYGYQVEFVEFDPTNYSDAKIKELASRNTHQVPESAIRSMRDKWVKIDAKKYRDAKTMAMTGTDLPTAMSFGPTLLHNADAKEATIDLKNGTVEGNITPQVIDEAGNQSTFIPNPNGTQEDINKGIYEEPDSPNLMAQTGRIAEAARRGAAAAVSAMRPAPVTSPTTSTRTQPIKNPAARAVFILNQILKAGAAGDASPVLMQNFPLALDKPDLFLRQLRLQAQVIFNPNLGWAGRNGRATSKSLMYGRKLAQDVWDNEVRNRASYDLAKVSGLSVSAISNEKDLEDAKLVDPLIQLMDISELGHNSDVATEADFLQHLPGQGQSERFFMLSKDVVKMRQFDDMVQHLVDIGYNPTEFKLDKDGKLIETHWTRAVKDIAHILNVISGDVRIIEEDETDEAVMRIAKLLLFSPRWTASRLMVDRSGRSVMSFVAKSVPGGSEKVEQILRMNGMSELQLKNRDPRVGALHARLLWKSWSLWLGVLAGIYAMRATNPRTMAVSIDKGGTRFKIGDYSFRMPGALMTQIEIMTSVIDGWGEWQAQKGTVSDKPLGSVVWEKVNQTLMSRASPILSTGVEAITQRDVLGQPAFVTDEAIKVFYEEVMEPMGLKGVPSEWNKALTKRVMWWWVRDCMEMYQTQREFGVEASEALIAAAATAAYSAEGGRVNYFPKALTQRIKAGQKMETQFDAPTDFFTGGKAVIPEVDLFNPDKGPQPQDIREPLFGGTGTDLNADILRRTEPPKK